MITLSLLKDVTLQQKELKSEEISAVELFGMKVLLVEDNELNQEIAVEMLEFLGVDVDVVADGRGGGGPGSKSGRRSSMNWSLSDIQNACDGWSRGRPGSIRRNGMEGIAELPIIAMTANAFSRGYQKEHGSQECRDTCQKPISIDNLRDALIRSRRWERRRGQSQAEKI